VTEADWLASDDSTRRRRERLLDLLTHQGTLQDMPASPRPHRPPGARAAQRAATRQHDQDRGSANARGYTRTWQKARAAYLLAHPLCAECKRRGLTSLATVVDHITPHRGDMGKFWSGDWESLCTTCHNRKTARGE
jgi:5-methylcytosine-specific restriction enzyme A